MQFNLYPVFFLGCLFASVGSSQTGRDSVGPNDTGFWRCFPCTTSGAADTELGGCCEERHPKANLRAKAGRVASQAGAVCCCGITAPDRDDRPDTVSPGLVLWHKGFFLVQPRIPLAFSFPEQPVSYPLAVHFSYPASYSAT